MNNEHHIRDKSGSPRREVVAWLNKNRAQIIMNAARRPRRNKPRSFFVLLTALVLLVSFGVSVPRIRAAEMIHYGALRVTVLDAISHAPISFAVVDIHGSVDRRGVTDLSGIVLFRSVPPGPYAITLEARQHLPLTLRKVIIVANTERRLRFSLRPLPASFQQGLQPSRPPTIANVRTGAGVPQAHTDKISDSDITTRISDSLRTSLGMVPGVALQSVGGDAAASIGGRSSAQTQTSVDGVPLLGPAQSIGLFSSGIFSSASVDVGTSSLSFTTPDPTLDWLARLAQAEGSHSFSQTTISESGTAARLGLSLVFSKVAQASALDGMRYLDSSGLDYVHDDTTSGDAFAAKLRYPTSRSNSLLFSYDSLHQAVPLVCNVYTAQVPCGYGPVDRNFLGFNAAQIRDSWSGSAVDGSLSLFSSDSNTIQDGSGLFYDGVSAPLSSFSRSLSNGLTLDSTIHAGPNYSVRAMWQTITTHSEFFSSLGSASPDTSFQYPSAHTSLFLFTAPLIQARRVSSSLSVTARSQLGYQASGLTFSFAYRPTNRDAISLQYRTGLLGRPTAYRTTVSDARSMAFDCANHTALGVGPSVEGADTQTTLAGISWTHSAARVTWELSATHAVDRNALVDAVVAAPDLDPNLFGPSFATELAMAGDRACGFGSNYTLDDALFNITGIAPYAVYDSAQVAAQIAIGPNIVTTLSAGISSARAYGASEPIFSTRSTVIQGRQLPGRPYATATWSFAYGTGHGPLILLDAHYVSKNNPNALPAYTTFDASVSVPTDYGQLSLSVRNLTNTHPGPFATSADAVPLSMLMGSYHPPAQPLAPRTFAVTYHVQVGRNPNSLEATSLPGGGRFISYDSLDSRGPLDIDRQSYLCGPELVPETRALFAAVGSYVQSIQAATVSNNLPATFADATFRGLRLTYRRSGQGFVVLIARAPTSSYASIRPLQQDVLSCGTFRTGTLAQAQRAGLYIPSWDERTTQKLLFGFSPRLGFYGLPPLIEEPSIHYLSLPEQPPTDPFGLNEDPGCTDEIRPAAVAFLGALEKFVTAYFSSGVAEPEAGLQILAHSDSAKKWLEVRDDNGFLDPIMPCLVLHSGSADDFRRLGFTVQSLGSINYAPELGLYVFK